MTGVEHGAERGRGSRGWRRLPAARYETGRSRERLHVRVEAGHLLGRQVEVVDPELARLAQDVVVDVGDVAHELGRVAEVAGRRRWSRSKVRYTWAWPMWAESYGVMPHEYMVTTGPGSNATTSPRAVS